VVDLRGGRERERERRSEGGNRWIFFSLFFFFSFFFILEDTKTDTQRTGDVGVGGGWGGGLMLATI